MYEKTRAKFIDNVNTQIEHIYIFFVTFLLKILDSLYIYIYMAYKPYIEHKNNIYILLFINLVDHLC